MAGIANLCSCAYENNFNTSFPTMTPALRLRTSVAPMIVGCIRSRESRSVCVLELISDMLMSEVERISLCVVCGEVCFED